MTEKQFSEAKSIAHEREVLKKTFDNATVALLERQNPSNELNILVLGVGINSKMFEVSLNTLQSILDIIRVDTRSRLEQLNKAFEEL